MLAIRQKRDGALVNCNRLKLVTCSQRETDTFHICDTTSIAGFGESDEGDFHQKRGAYSPFDITPKKSLLNRRYFPTFTLPTKQTTYQL